MRKLVFMIALLMLAVSGCTGSSPSRDEGSPATPSPTPSRGASVTAPSSTSVPVRNVLVDYGSGRIVVPVPLAWSHRSGHILFLCSSGVLLAIRVPFAVPAPAVGLDRAQRRAAG